MDMKLRSRFIKRVVLLVSTSLILVGCNASKTISEPATSTINAELSNNEINSVAAEVATAIPLTSSATPSLQPTNTTLAISSATPTSVPANTDTPPPLQLLPEEMNAITGLLICNRMGEFFIIEESGNPNKVTNLQFDAFQFNNGVYFIQDSDVWVEYLGNGESYPLVVTDDIVEQHIYGRLGEWLLVKPSLSEEQNTFQPLGSVILLKLDGSEHRILEATIIGEPNLSDDGKFAIIPTQNEVLLIDENLIQSSPFAQHFYFSTISPNNMYVAHNGSKIGVSEIFSGNIVAEFEYQGALTVGDIPPEPFQWSPDNERVAVETFNLLAEPPAVPNQIFVFNIMTHEAQTISNAWNPRWSPDGKILLFTTNPRKPRIQLLRFSEPAWQVIETNYEGLPVRWNANANLQTNGQQPVPKECKEP